MSYPEFTIKKLRKEFGVKDKLSHLFEPFAPLQPSDLLVSYLELAAKVNIKTEKAKSEAIVFPILLELKRLNEDFVTLYSGDHLNVDPSKGLNGECDFILSKDTQSIDISYPIMQIVEAKNHDIQIGIPQCAAQMVGAKLYNQENEINLDVVYGCVTTGDEWLFMKLEKDMLLVDKRKYYLNELGGLLSIFQHIIDYYKSALTESA